MYYLVYNNYGECPRIIDDVDMFHIDEEMIHVHSVTCGDINLRREAWDIVHLMYYTIEDYMLNQEVKNGKNKVY